MKNKDTKKNTRKEVVTTMSVAVATVLLTATVSSFVISEPYKIKDYTVGEWLKAYNSKTCVDEGIRYMSDNGGDTDYTIGITEYTRDIDELEKLINISNRMQELCLDKVVNNISTVKKIPILALGYLDQLIDLYNDKEFDDEEKAILLYNEGVINERIHNNAKKIITKYGDIVLKCEAIDAVRDNRLNNSTKWSYKNLDDVNIIYNGTQDKIPDSVSISLLKSGQDVGTFTLTDDMFVLSRMVYDWNNNDEFEFTKNVFGLDNCNRKFNQAVWVSIELIKNTLNTKAKVVKTSDGVQYIKKNRDIVEQ